MRPWKHEVNIKQYLTEDAKAIEIAYDGIRKELSRKNLIWPEEFDEYSELAITRGDAAIFNIGMVHLYDWADAERIWLA